MVRLALRTTTLVAASMPAEPAASKNFLPWISCWAANLSAPSTTSEMVCALWSAGDRRGDAFGGFHVAVVKRDVADRRDAQLGAVGHQCDGQAKERRVVRAFAEASGDTDDVDHG